MNKSTPEYIRVREEIAQWLSMRFVYGRDNEFNPLNFGGLNENEQKQALRDADSILAIKGIAILADKQQLPEHYDGIYTGYEEAVQRDMLKVNFKKVVE
jgi:hypothetical protein